MTYGSAFEVYCARYGREVDTAIATFKNRCCARSGGPLPDSEAQRRFQLQLKVRFWSSRGRPAVAELGTSAHLLVYNKVEAPRQHCSRHHQCLKLLIRMCRLHT